MMRRRRGPGLVRMAATTAVVAGTAGAVRHHQEQKYQNQAAEQQAEQQAIYDQGVAAAQQAPPAAPPAPGDGPDRRAPEARLAQAGRHPHRRGVRGGEGEAPRLTSAHDLPHRRVAGPAGHGRSIQRRRPSTMDQPRRTAPLTPPRRGRSPHARAAIFGVLVGVALVAGACDGANLPSGFGSNLPSLAAILGRATLPDRSIPPDT